MTALLPAAGFIALLPVRIPGLPFGLAPSDFFLPLLAVLVGRDLRRLPGGIQRSDVFALVLLAAGALSVLWHPSAAGAILLAKRSYLLVVYASFAVLASRGWAARAVAWLAASAAAFAGVSLAAAVLHVTGGSSILPLGESMRMPYVGEVYRLKGLFETPEMFAELLTLVIPLALAMGHAGGPRYSRRWRVAAGVCALAAALTFAGGAVGACVATAIVLWPDFDARRFRFLRPLIAAGTLVTVVAVNLALCVSVRNFALSRDRDPNIPPAAFHHAFHDRASGAPRVRLEVTYEPMSYWLLKRAAWAAFRSSPIVGIGLGRFHDVAQDAALAGAIDKRYRRSDPHSTWLGALSETGMAGGLALIAFWVASLASSAAFCRENPGDRIARALLAGCIGILVNSPNVDVMNFRFLWLALGLSRGLQGNQRT